MRGIGEESGRTGEATARGDIPDYAMRDFGDPGDTPTGRTDADGVESEASPDRDGHADGHVDAREAAGMLGVGQRAVRTLVGRGWLEGKREGEGAAARLLVSVASVERLREERRGESQALYGHPEDGYGRREG